MSLPQRPGKASPRRDERSAFREPSRRHRRRDIETGAYSDDPQTSPSSHRRHRRHSHSHRKGADTDEERMERGVDVRRKKSLVKPERRHVDREHRDYHYRQRSQQMPTYPPAAGNDPLLDRDGEAETNSSRSMDMKTKEHMYGNINKPMDRAPSRHRSKKKKSSSSRRVSKGASAQEKQRQKALEAARPPDLWTTYCALVSCLVPDFVLKCFGMPQKEQRSAWREKIGLISIILMIAAFVGFLTFGFTATVCGSPPVRLKVNEVGSGYMIFHGEAYDLTGSKHAAAEGIPAGTNVLYDLPHKYGGQDGSFFFQQVNGECKGLITAVDGGGVPTNSKGDLGWYFPCQPFNQDGSSEPNLTSPYYLGWACHTSAAARNPFYSLRSSGDVYYTWEDTKNKSRNLAVYSGNVLDLDLLRWFNTSQVSYPSEFDLLRENPAVRGVDLTYYLQSGDQKQIGKCLEQIIKVGSIDTDTVGCIASKVVLYVSLIFILSIVVVKFGFALLFQWFLAPRFAAQKTSMSSDTRTRNQQIEDWSNDIYRPGPRVAELPVPSVNKRASFLPTTSRFSSPYNVNSASGKQPSQYVTMASQNSTSRLMPSSTTTGTMYKMSHNSSGGTLSIDARGNPAASRTSLVPGQQDQGFSTIVSESEGPGPAGFIHEAVVPQPPPEWQPFGYPLAHALCLVTCYSEGEEGIRSTLDSIAMTDYPNSHKTILVICDGIIKGKGEEFSTPDIVLGMMKDHVIPPEEVQPFSYVAVATGSKRHNMSKVYTGFYDYGETSVIPPERQQRVPMMVIVKCGTPAESSVSKPGNRGKRDSQIILMSFLQKVMFDERMTELEFEMFNGLWNVTGIPPDFYEVVLMVDADTKVFPDSLTHMISAMVKDPEIMGLCGETKIANKTDSWVTMIQVFEYVFSPG
jgi:chitin synthase